MSLGILGDDICEKGNLLSLLKMSWSLGKSCGLGKCRESMRCDFKQRKVGTQAPYHLPHASLSAGNNVAVSF